MKGARIGWRYFWAFPTTLLGLLVLLPHVFSRGKVQLVDGVLELHGGLVSWLLRHGSLLDGGIAALTLGHVVLAQTAQWHEQTRTHERVHVRQCERWGVFFLPAYFLASAWAGVTGRHFYTDNAFEIEARRIAGY